MVERVNDGKGEKSECWRGWMLERVNGGKGVN